MKAAKATNQGYWEIDTNGDPEKLEMVTDAAMKNVTEILQRAIIHLTNTRDARRLQVLQSCTLQLYKQAQECFENDLNMTITDEHQNTNLN